MSEPFLVHCHIPKTGGSALNQRFLFPRFGTDRVQLLYRYVFEAAHRLPPRHTSPAMRCFAATGHIPFGYFKRVYPGATYLSVFREPVSRALSFLNFVLATPDHKVRERLDPGVLARAPADPDSFILATLADPRLAVVQANVQTRLASGCARLGDAPIDALHLDVATDNLARPEYVVGDQTNLGAVMAELRARFPAPAPSGPTPQPNAQAEKRLPKLLHADQISPRTHAALTHANRFDLQFYERIRRRTENLVAA